MITCIGCGCSNARPCIDPITGETCSWVLLETAPGSAVMHINGLGLCSFCAEEGAIDDDYTVDDARFNMDTHQALQRSLDRDPEGELFFGKPTDAERDAPLVQLVSDAEADRFLRARRAGA